MIGNEPLKFFNESVLHNIRFWEMVVQEEANNISELDASRKQIIDAVIFALDLPESWPHVTTIIEHFSPYVEKQGHWAEWKPVLRQALDFARQQGDTAQVIDLSIRLARLAQQQNRFQDGIRYYRQVIRMARRVGDQISEARACSNMGYIYTELGFWHRAEVLSCYALDIFNNTNYHHGQAHTENHLGVLYTEYGQWKVAEQYLKQAQNRWQRMNDNHGLMYVFINLGFLYNEMSDAQRSLPYLQQAEQQAKLAGEESELGTIYLNMSHACRINQDPAQTEMFAQQAETYFRQFSNSRYLPLAWMNLGEAYFEQGRWDDAKKYLELALSTCRNIGYTSGEVKALVCFIEFEIAKKNYQNAKIWLNKLEIFIEQSNEVKQRKHLQSLAQNYRRSLRNYN